MLASRRDGRGAALPANGLSVMNMRRLRDGSPADSAKRGQERNGVQTRIDLWRESRAWLEDRGLTRAVVRDSVLVWTWQRVFLFALIAFWQIITRAAYGFGSALSPHSLFQPLLAYDGLRYAEIARNGYDQLPQAAFFPLYPLLERIAAPLVGGNVEIAGVLLSNGAALCAFLLLRLLVTRDVDDKVARRTLILLAFFPTSMFFVAAYTESLFLLFSVAAFLAIRRHRWALAGGLIALATLTRSAGVLLLLPLALEAIACYGPDARRRKLPMRRVASLVVALVLPVVLLLLWRLYLDRHFGIPNALGRAIASSDWERELSWPWYGILQAARADITGAALWMRTKATRDLLFTCLWLVCTVAMVLRRASLPRGYTIYAVGSLALALVFPIHARPYDALNSTDRYMLVVFPCFVLAAQWSLASPGFWRVLRLGLLLGLIVMSAFFALGGFIG